MGGIKSLKIVVSGLAERYEDNKANTNNNTNVNNNNNMSTDVVISGDRNVIKKDPEKFMKNTKKINRNSARVKCESKSDTSNNMRDWNHLKITQTIPEQHAGKARNQGSTKNNHIGHFTPN